MTLIVSLRIPDGIVLAGDSLATMNNNLEVTADLDITCPQCNHAHHITQPLGAMNVPATTLSYAQKIFPFLQRFGIGIFGQSILANKSVSSIIRGLEADVKRKAHAKQPKDVDEVAGLIDERISEALKDHLAIAKKAGIDVDKAIPANSIILGLQIVGYTKGNPHTIALEFTKTKTNKQHFEGLNLTVSGDNKIFKGLEDFYAANQQYRPVYPLFSLQDAIEYSEFLVNTTGTIQHFSSSMATVGGETDIILVTPFEDYQWIKQKSLQSKIGGHLHA